MFKKVFIITSVFALMFLIIIAAQAQSKESNGLAISPMSKEITVDPDSSVSGTIKVNNPTTSILNVDVKVQDFKASGEEGGQAFIDSEENNNSYSLVKWVTTDKSFVLKPDETKEISYTINVPDNAEPGGHYGVIFFNPSLEKSPTLTTSGAIVVPQIGSLLLVTVPGKITYGAKLASFSTAKNLYLDTTNSVEFLTRFQNISSVHVKPAGTITVKNIFGNTVGILVVNAQEGKVLPDSIRKFTSDWQKSYGFGPYKASVTLNYGTGQTVSGNLMFWIFPWKITLCVIIFVIILIYIVSRLQWKKR